MEKIEKILKHKTTKKILIGLSLAIIIYFVLKLVSETLASIFGMLIYGALYLTVISIIFKKVFKPGINDYYKNKKEK